jgi:hypothetical protein
VLDERCKVAANLNELTQPQRDTQPSKLLARIDALLSHGTLFNDFPSLQDLKKHFNAAISANKTHKEAATKALFETIDGLPTLLNNRQYCSVTAAVNEKKRGDFTEVKNALARYLSIVEEAFNI